MKKLIFVDDDTRTLESIRRMLHSRRREWDLDFASSAIEALDRMAEKEYDVVVTDIQMYSMSGIEFLELVLQRHPTVVRIVLSGSADSASALPALGLAHQYLAKPCRHEVLCGALERALAIRFLPHAIGLHRFVVGVQCLPSLPADFAELLAELDSAEAVPRKIGALVARDAALTAKVLQVANSAYFALQKTILSPVDAVVYFGVDMLRAIVMSSIAYNSFSTLKIEKNLIARIREESTAVTPLARSIAKSLQVSNEQTSTTLCASMLQDIGKLLLAADRDKFAKAVVAERAGEHAAIQAEAELFGATHAEVGGYLLWLWGLPELAARVVALHHGPVPDPGDPARDPVIALRAAHRLLQTGTSPIDCDLTRFIASAPSNIWQEWAADSIEVRSGC